MRDDFVIIIFLFQSFTFIVPKSPTQSKKKTVRRIKL